MVTKGMIYSYLELLSLTFVITFGKPEIQLFLKVQPPTLTSFDRKLLGPWQSSNRSLTVRVAPNCRSACKGGLILQGIQSKLTLMLLSKMDALPLQWLLETREGSWYFACSKRVNTNLPLQAKVKAIKQAVFVGKNLDAIAIYVESDFKSSVDSLVCSKQVPWRVRGICTDISCTLQQIPHCFVNWVSREANNAAHILAKWSLLNNVYASFDLDNGSPYVVSAIRLEASLLSL